MWCGERVVVWVVLAWYMVALQRQKDVDFAGKNVPKLVRRLQLSRGE